ncbi:MAG: hypothetical protein IPJ30_12200 [Acidobacteria bacterium]|nr:hypothetical protein [Acidobacteriota bacterium]MBK8150466.1 hypothetical protein [Acidobacteriota bacterium]
MSFYLKAAAGIGSSLLVVLALVIALLKGLIGLIGFVTTAIKIIIVLGFVAVFVGVGILVFRTFRESRRNND